MMHELYLAKAINNDNFASCKPVNEHEDKLE